LYLDIDIAKDGSFLGIEFAARRPPLDPVLQMPGSII